MTRKASTNKKSDKQTKIYKQKLMSSLDDGSVTITITLPADLRDSLVELAEVENSKVSPFCRQLFERHFFKLAEEGEIEGLHYLRSCIQKHAKPAIRWVRKKKIEKNPYIVSWLSEHEDLDRIVSEYE